MTTMQDVTRIVGRDLGEPAGRGKWITWEQPWSRALTNDMVGRLKKAGIPAFFSADRRCFGVLASALVEG
jgi:hypothetical protein